MADVITCPSGLSGRVRGMKVREERVLADRKLAKNGGQIDELLGSCWEETLDPGPYAFGEGGKVDWGKVLQGDRFFALLLDGSDQALALAPRLSPSNGGVTADVGAGGTIAASRQPGVYCRPTCSTSW